MLSLQRLIGSLAPQKFVGLKTFLNLIRAPAVVSSHRQPQHKYLFSSVVYLEYFRTSSLSSGATIPRFLACRSFCSHPSKLDSELQGPAPIDYCSTLQEDEFHKLADSTIHHLLEKVEEYGDSVQMDGFDIDYGNQVLTLKLGDLGTYVLNKQTPNRQIWLSSPVSGPARFDWDGDTGSWVYRRNKASLTKLLEEELEQLCGEPINLS